MGSERIWREIRIFIQFKSRIASCSRLAVDEGFYGKFSPEKGKNVNKPMPTATSYCNNPSFYNIHSNSIKHNIQYSFSK